MIDRELIYHICDNVGDIKNFETNLGLIKQLRSYMDPYSFDVCIIPVCMRVDVFEIAEHTRSFVMLIHNQELQEFMMHFMKCVDWFDVYESKYQYELLLNQLRMANSNPRTLEYFKRAFATFGRFIPYQMGTRWVYEWCYIVSLKNELTKFYRYTIPFLSNQEVMFPHRTNTQKPRVGFLSRHMSSNHSVGKIFSPIILGLSDAFDIYLYTFSSDLSGYTLQTYIPKFVKYYEFGQKDDESMVQFFATIGDCIINDNLDLLIFLDIGADRYSYFSSFKRVAPIQVAWWGFHDSDCTETDYFVSSNFFDDNQCFYGENETLVRFHTLGFIPIGENDQNNETSIDNVLPIDANVHYYVCIQNIIKVNAEFCDILTSILEKDSNARIVLFTTWVGCASYKHCAIEKYFADLGWTNRVMFITPMSKDKYISLIRQAHVILDTQPFGGCLTSIDCMQLGVPIVAAAYNRCTKATITAGIYRAIGFTELIAKSKREYVDLAVKLATNASYRFACGNTIQKKFHSYFENKANKQLVIDEWADFIDRIITNKLPHV